VSGSLCCVLLLVILSLGRSDRWARSTCRRRSNSVRGHGVAWTQHDFTASSNLLALRDECRLNCNPL
jgi:hypothetical protein